MKNDKAFTLVELLGVIAIIAIISIIAFPNIINTIRNQEVKLTETQKEIIYSSVDLYISNNPSTYPLDAGKTYSIPIQDLIDNNILSLDFVESISNFSDNKCVNVYILDANGNTEKTISDCTGGV